MQIYRKQMIYKEFKQLVINNMPENPIPGLWQQKGQPKTHIALRHRAYHRPQDEDTQGTQQDAHARRGVDCAVDMRRIRRKRRNGNGATSFAQRL